MTVSSSSRVAPLQHRLAEGAADALDALDREAPAGLKVHAGHVGLDAVRQRVHAGVGRQLGGQGDGDLGVQYADVGDHIGAHKADLQNAVRVRNHAAGGDLRARPRRCGNGDAGEELVLDLVHASSQVLILVHRAAVGVDHVGRLAGVDCRAAAIADHELRPRLLHVLHRLMDGLIRGIGLQIAVDVNRIAGTAQRLDRLQGLGHIDQAAVRKEDDLLPLEAPGLVRQTQRGPRAHHDPLRPVSMYADAHLQSLTFYYFTGPRLPRN